jgi:hypothetical protein
MSYVIFETFSPTAQDPGQLFGTSKFGTKHAVQAVITSFFHSQIHKENAYLYGVRQTLGSGAETEIVIVAPSSGLAHLEISVKGSGALYTDLYEDSSDAYGSERTAVFNRMRTSNKTPKMKIYDVGTSSGGTIIDPNSAGSGQSTSGETGRTFEFGIGNAKIYRLLIHSNAASNLVTTRFEWYEPDEIY